MLQFGLCLILSCAQPIFSPPPRPRERPWAPGRQRGGRLRFGRTPQGIPRPRGRASDGPLPHCAVAQFNSALPTKPSWHLHTGPVFESIMGPISSGQSCIEHASARGKRPSCAINLASSPLQFHGTQLSLFLQQYFSPFAWYWKCAIMRAFRGPFRRQFR